MAKRKSSQPRLSADLVLIIGRIIIVLILFLGLVWGCKTYVSRSGLFTVADIFVSDSMGTEEIPELSRLKGHPISLVRLDKLEAKLHSKYPTLSNLKVMRRFPNQIVVTAVRREPYARAAFNGRVLLIDREGYLLGPASAEQANLPLVKGLHSPKTAAGAVVEDSRLDMAVAIISAFRETRALAPIPLRSLDISDMVRIVCLVGDAASEEIEVIVDARSFASRVGELGVLLSHNEIDLAGVKYIDLRFAAPIIGQKKQNKT